jgi:dihydroneopterin aldolase
MTIQIKNLTFETIIGILPFERQNPQKVIINGTITYNYSSQQCDFIDYALVVEEIKSTLRIQKFELIETALITTSAHLKHTFPLIESLTLCIIKPSILPDAEVGVSYTQNFSPIL